MTTWIVVEDEPDVYEVLLAMFQLWGIDGVGFVDGEEAIAWIEDVDAGRFSGELPELALLDIRLPGIYSGVEVGARLRSSPALSSMAITLCTAYRLTPEEEIAFVAKAGADRLMYKPLPPFNQLQRILDEIVASPRARTSRIGSLGVSSNQAVTTTSRDAEAASPTLSQLRMWKRLKSFLAVPRLSSGRNDRVRVIDGRVRETLPSHNLIREILVGLTIVMLAGALGLFISSDRASYLTNLWTEGVSIAVTIFILDRLARNREEKRTAETLRSQLLNMIGSSVHQDCLRAVEQLDRLGWLRDGTMRDQSLDFAQLQNAQLTGANFERSTFVNSDLKNAKLQEVNFQNCLMKGANLENADLTGANLKGATLIGGQLRNAKLNLANLEGANLREADLTEAIFNPNTILPDGSPWASDTDMSRFTAPQR